MRKQGKFVLAILLAAFLVVPPAAAYAYRDPVDIQNNTIFRTIGQYRGADVYRTEGGDTVVNFVGNEAAKQASSGWGVRVEYKYERGLNNLGFTFRYEGLAPGSSVLLALQGYTTAFPTAAQQRIGEFLFAKFFRGDGVTAVDGAASDPGRLYFNLGRGGNFVPVNDAQREEPNFNLLGQCWSFPILESGNTIAFSTSEIFDPGYNVRFTVAHNDIGYSTTVSDAVLHEVYDRERYSGRTAYIGGRVAVAHFHQTDSAKTVKLTFTNVRDAVYESEAYSRLVAGVTAYRNTLTGNLESAEAVRAAYRLRRDIDVYAGNLHIEDINWALENRNAVDAALEERYYALLSAEVEKLQAMANALMCSEADYERVRTFADGLDVQTLLTNAHRKELTARIDAVLRALDAAEAQALGEPVIVRRAMRAIRSYNAYVGTGQDLTDARALIEADALRKRVEMPESHKEGFLSLLRDADNCLTEAKRRYLQSACARLDAFVGSKQYADYVSVKQILSELSEVQFPEELAACVSERLEQEEKRLAESPFSGIRLNGTDFDKDVAAEHRDYLKLTDAGVEFRLKRSDASGARASFNEGYGIANFCAQFQLLDFALLNTALDRNEVVFGLYTAPNAQFGDAGLCLGFQPKVLGGFTVNVYAGTRKIDAFEMERPAAPCAASVVVSKTDYGYYLSVNGRVSIVSFSDLPQDAFIEDTAYAGFSSFFNNHALGNPVLVTRMGNWSFVKEARVLAAPPDERIAVVLVSVLVPVTLVLAFFGTVWLWKMIKKRSR